MLLAAAALCFAGLLALSSDDDDVQTLRFKGTSGPFTVAVFAPRGEVAVGSSAFSVLVLDLDSQDVQLDATVDLAARSAANSQQAPITATASNADSANKLLQSAELNLPNEGDWTLSITVKRNSNVGELSMPLRVVKPGTEVEFPWADVAIVTFAVILFGAYLGRHRSRQAEHPVQV